MADVPVHVVPTRNVAEGIAAVMELEPSRTRRGERRLAMTEAGRAVQTLQATEAVRDATVSGRKVKKGQTIVLDPDDGLLAVRQRPAQGGPGGDRQARRWLQRRDASTTATAPR